MKNPVFTGAGVAIITPMYEDGSINFDELGRIIEDQIKGGTDAVVLCHNHPNGMALPSREDIQATENIVRALGLVRVHLRDHIILTESEYFSMRDENRLPFYDFATGEMLRPY